MNSWYKSIAALGIVCVTLVGYQYMGAYSDPAAGAISTSNTDAPLNEGTGPQVKNGPLGVDALGVFGDSTVSGTTTGDTVRATVYCDENGENCAGGTGGINVETISMESWGAALTANERCQMAGFDGYFSGMDSNGLETIRCFHSNIVTFETCTVITAGLTQGGNYTEVTRYYPSSLNITHIILDSTTSNYVTWWFDITVRSKDVGGDTNGWGAQVDDTGGTPGEEEVYHSGKGHKVNVIGIDNYSFSAAGQNGTTMYMDYQANVDCLQTDIPVTGEDMLVNGTHTAKQCVEAGGQVAEASSGTYVCQFNADGCGTTNLFGQCVTTNAVCPAGWTSYNNWNAYPSKTCSNTCQGYTGSCTTTDLAWGSNPSTPSCTYTRQSGEECNRSNQVTCTALRAQIGCY